MMNLDRKLICITAERKLAGQLYVNRSGDLLSPPGQVLLQWDESVPPNAQRCIRNFTVSRIAWSPWPITTPRLLNFVRAATDTLFEKQSEDILLYYIIAEQHNLFPTIITPLGVLNLETAKPILIFERIERVLINPSVVPIRLLGKLSRAGLKTTKQIHDALKEGTLQRYNGIGPSTELEIIAHYTQLPDDSPNERILVNYPL